MEGMRAVISTGSNMGDGVGLLGGVVDKLTPLAASSLYETQPWGGVEQPPFLNQVLIVNWRGSAEELLARCQELERAAHRVREVRWGPRTLDVDIVDFGDMRVDAPALTLPHPRAHLREFVLRPWLEIDPEATLHGKPLQHWLDQLEPQGVRKLEATT